MKICCRCFKNSLIDKVKFTASKLVRDFYGYDDLCLECNEFLYQENKDIITKPCPPIGTDQLNARARKYNNSPEQLRAKH